MSLQLALEVVAYVVVAWLVATQVVLPLWRGTKLFPRWRTIEPELERKEADARQRRREQDILDRINRKP